MRGSWSRREQRRDDPGSRRHLRLRRPPLRLRLRRAVRDGELRRRDRPRSVHPDAVRHALALGRPDGVRLVGALESASRGRRLLPLGSGLPGRVPGVSGRNLEPLLVAPGQRPVPRALRPRGRPLRALADRLRTVADRRRLHRRPHLPQLPGHRHRGARGDPAQRVPAGTPRLAHRRRRRPLAGEPHRALRGSRRDTGRADRHGPGLVDVALLRLLRGLHSRRGGREPEAGHPVRHRPRHAAGCPELRPPDRCAAGHEHRLGHVDLGAVRDRRLRARRAGARAVALPGERGELFRHLPRLRRLVVAARLGPRRRRLSPRLPDGSSTRASARPIGCCSPTGCSTP